MDSALVTAAFGAGCASLGSLVTGLVLKTSERRRALRDAGRLEVERKVSLDRYEALRELSTAMAELHHCVMHLSDSRSVDQRDWYLESARDYRLKARRIARAQTEFFGRRLCNAVVEATDTLQQFLDRVAAQQPDVGSMEIANALRHEWRGQADTVAKLMYLVRRDLHSS